MYLKKIGPCETWGAHPADERGCEAPSSLENTINHFETMKDQCPWKWFRTCLETCKRHQGASGMIFDTTRLTTNYFKQSDFWICSIFRQKCFGFRTWGGYSWNLRRKSWRLESIMFYLDTIWLMKSGFPMVLFLLRVDPQISETCPLEESVSHHLRWKSSWSMSRLFYLDTIRPH